MKLRKTAVYLILFSPIALVAVPVTLMILYATWHSLATNLSNADPQNIVSKQPVCGDAAKWRIAEGRVPFFQGVNGTSHTETFKKIAEACYWEGGNFSGTVFFCSFSCDNVEMCWEVLEFIADIDRATFTLWRTPTYVETMTGPEKYWPGVSDKSWRLDKITSGFVYEQIHIGKRPLALAPEEDYVQSIAFYAVDAVHSCVYIQVETGGIFMSRVP